jgi:sulfite reductase (NADPH) flavoprotein alpha-component
MELAIIPESAPFDPEQRAWLNGFLAGWLGLHRAAEATTAEAPASPPAEVEEFPWHDPSLSMDERLGLAEGRPLERRLMAAMAQLDCGACGYDCRRYSEAIATGQESSLTLCSPGGAETAKALRRIVKESADDSPPALAKASSDAPAPRPNWSGWSRSNPYPARIIRSVNLNGPGSAKRTHHVEIDLGHGGLRYEVGDALGVFPTNCPELVADLIDTLAVPATEPLTLPPDGLPSTLREALTRHACLAEATDALLGLLARSAADPAEAEVLARLVEDDEPVGGCDVLDLLRRFPSARPSPAEFVAALAPIRPRLYSISSSPRRHPTQVHLTVGRVAYTSESRLRKGVASTMLADRLAPGDEVRVFVQPSHGFRLPDDPSAPIIMIGPGTGLAPFRGFLQDREAAGAAGRSWLFFGDQRSATDFLYREELESYLRSGVLTRLSTAFSRDQENKIYVQDRMIEAGVELFAWLEEGAHVFVCGDARRMAPDVDRALHRIVREHGHVGDDGASEYLAGLRSVGRYRMDVY